jgi:hypothetical protein
VISDALELLDRQVSFLLKQKEQDFFMQLPAFVESLHSDPRVEAVSSELCGDAADQLEKINARRFEVREALLNARELFVGAFPGANDGHVSPAQPGDSSWSEYRGSLAQFDAFATEWATRWPSHRQIDSDPVPLERMSSLLDSKLTSVDRECEDPAATPVRLALGNAGRQLTHVQRDYDLATMTSAAVAAARVLATSAALNPEPRVQTMPLEFSQLWSHTLDEIFGVGGLVREYVYERGRRREPKSVAEIESSVRQDVERFHEEVRRRLGLRRSLWVIVDRYKMRAEWHDAAVLRELAAAHKGQVELALTANFARYLHDQGLNPLTKIRTGGLEPDVLAPFADSRIRWTFYAEAKQYSKPCVAYLRNGIREVADHLNTLRGGPFEVREAFYVVFRLDGPLYHLPEKLPLGDVTMHPILIDIGETRARGSRAKFTPVTLTEADLLPPEPKPKRLKRAL